MIVLDTHIWIWWVNRDDKELSENNLDLLDSFVSDGLGVSVISCLEAAQRAATGRGLILEPDFPVWIEQALQYPGVRLLDLTPAIAVASYTLPGDFHGDPSDRIIVATARQFNVRLATVDEDIIDWYIDCGLTDYIDFRK